MTLRICRKGAALLFLLSTVSAHSGEDTREIWDKPVTRVWMNNNIAAVHRARRASPSFRLAGTQISASGIAPSSMHAFAPNNFDRTVGAKLQPFDDLNFKVGTALTRSGSEEGFLSSIASWEAFWLGDRKGSEGLALGLSTVGTMDNLQAGYSQSLSGTLAMPLDVPLAGWRADFQVSPSINLDASSGSMSSGLFSEIRGRTVISSHDSSLRSVLNVSLGYSLAPHAQPVASGKLELIISPNL
jgi:hypothetical protein